MFKLRLLAVAMLPVLLLMRYVFRKDRLEKEPAKLLFRLMLGGALFAFVPVILEGLGDRLLTSVLKEGGLLYYLLDSYLVVGLSEEGMKRFVLKRRTWNSSEFNCSFDSIVYASYVSLGFALLENIVYVSGYAVSSGLAVGLLRAVTAIPAHFFTAVFMGLYYGRAKECQLNSDLSGMERNMRLSLWIPIALHGTYDALAFISTYMDSNLCSYLFYAYLIMLYIVSFRTVKCESAQDRYLTADKTDPAQF